MLSRKEVEAALERVFPVAERFGLDPGHVHFDIVPSAMVQTLASSGGLPVRYGHWSFGKARQRLQTAFDFRMTQIYELVLNHVPAYAFIDQSCSKAQVLMIAAHVLAHADYFRHHRGFADVPTDMVAVAARHRRTLETLRRIHGDEQVETLLNAAHVLADFSGETLSKAGIGDLADDVLGFAARHAPRLEEWERQVLSIVWEETRYFWPQVMTRLANEGYATFFHTRLLRQLDLSPQEIWETAKLNAQIVQVSPPQLNPYRLGYQLFDEAFRQGGFAAVFAARDLYDDVGLVRAYLTSDGVLTAGLTVYREDDAKPLNRPVRAEEVKRRLLTDLDRAGLPRLLVEEHGVNGLVLRHRHDGRDLDFAELPFALKAVAERLWKGPVTLLTHRQGVAHRVSHDGREWLDQVI
jgi:stage V sporulation protein R